MRSVPTLAFVLALVWTLPVRAADDEAMRAALAAAGDAGGHGGANLVVVFDRTENRCEDNGRSTVTHAVLTKILKEEGARERSVLALDYDPRTNRVEFLRVRVFKNGGPAVDLPLEAADIPAPAGIIFWGGRRKILAVPGLEPGDGLEVVTLSVGYNIAYLGGDDERYVPPMRGHFYDVVPFWTGVPVLEKRYTLRAPRGKEVRFGVFQGALETSQRFEGDETITDFVARDLAPFEGEEHMVSHWDVAPKLVLATVPDWPTKSRWFFEVNEPQFAADEALKRETARIVADCITDSDKIRALVHWVADEVRYLGLSMGEGEGYVTHPASMTLADRAGVCKDKAGLLTAMLRVLGFDAYIAMTQVGSRVEEIPADQFNHAVTALKLADGRFVMLDPTWAPASRELWSSLEQEQNFVIGTREGEPLEATPSFAPGENPLAVRSQARVAPGPEGAALSGTLVLDADGYPDTWLRRRRERTPPGDQRRLFEDWLGAIAAGTELRELEVPPLRDYAGPSTVTLRWRAEGATAGSGGLRFVRSPVLRLLPALPLVDRLREAAKPETRRFPVNLRDTLAYHFHETLEAPPGWSFRDPAAGAGIGALEMEAVAAAGDERYAVFSLKRTVAEGALVLEGALVIPRKTVPPEGYAAFRRVIRELEDAVDAWFVLERTP